MFEYNQWVLYYGKPARVGHYIDDKYLIHILIPHGFDHIKVQPSEITAVDVPEFNIGTTVLYVGKDIPSLKHKYLTIKGYDDTRICSYVIKVNDISYNVTPFEIVEVNY